MCRKERKRDRDRARKAAMPPEQRALLNKRRRELYAQKNPSKKPTVQLQMTPNVTSLTTGIAIILRSSLCNKNFYVIIVYLLYQ